MDWFDDSTDYSAWGGTDFGSDYAPDASWMNYGGDLMSQFPSDPGGLMDWSGYSQTANTPSAPYYSPGSPGATGQSWYDSLLPSGTGAASPWLAGALGAAGPLAGLIGSLASGGVTGSKNYAPTTAQKAILNQAYPAGQQLGLLAQGQTPLQQQQASLLNAIYSGQGLAQPYAAAVEQAFQPQLGSLYQQAVEQGRRSGFYDSPATAPPGGAILGPGLSDLQGQIAAAKLKTMFDLPAAFNQPIQSQGNFASNWMSGALGVPQNQQNTQPIGSQIGTGIGNVIGGAAQGYGLSQTQQQQQQIAQQGQTNNSLLQALLMREGQTNLSGAY